MIQTPTESLLSFINQSPTPFHACQELTAMLTRAGFVHLDEKEPWGELEPGKYLVCRDQASLIAFTLVADPPAATGWRMAGAHTDSPCLKLKPNPVQQKNNHTLLAVEVYGGPLLNPWFDRDLSLAGRVSWLAGEGVCHELIDLRLPIGIVPSLAIHLDREANTKRNINKQNDLSVLVGTNRFALDTLLANALSRTIEPDVFLAHDLFFYPVEPARCIGIDNDLLAGPRLDNLVSCFCLTQAMINTHQARNSLILLSTHEEVGSQSAQGAQGPFLDQVLGRLVPDTEQWCQAMANSLMLSVDNAHASHPNAADRHDPDHQVLLNNGIAIKWNAGQRYATDSRGAAFFKALCKRSSIAAQDFVMRNDMASGSTIGPITASRTGMRTLDIGIPSLAMHSAREVCATGDIDALQAVLASFFSLAENDPLWSSKG